MSGQVGNYLTVIAALASILGLLVSLFDVPTWGRLTLGGLFLLVIALLGLQFLGAKRELNKIKRHEMIDTGKRLICEARRHVVLFGDDISWAPDYVAAIRQVVADGKRVTVIHTAGKSPDNERILVDGGAIMVAVPQDPCIRGILVDPADRDSVFFAAYKRRRHINIESPDQPAITWNYYGKVFERGTHWVMVETAAKLYRVLSGDESMMGR